MDLPGFPKQPLDQQKVDKGIEDLNRAVKHIDEYFLKDKPFIAGEEISVADVLAVCELTHLQAVELETLYTSNPKVDAWIKRVTDKLNPDFDEVNKPLVGFRAKYVEST